MWPLDRKVISYIGHEKRRIKAAVQNMDILSAEFITKCDSIINNMHIFNTTKKIILYVTNKLN
jgi:hypothetical protein